MKTRPLTWLVLVLCVITGVLLVSVAPEASPPRSCKPIDRETLVLLLGTERQEAAADFIAKAERLSASGLCVIEGGYGNAHQKFYFAIDRDGRPQNYYFLRFPRDELRK